MKYPAIPKSKKKQIKKLEKTIHSLFDLILLEKGWDDPTVIPLLLPQDVIRISRRSYKREDSRRAKKQRRFFKKNYGINVDDYLYEIKQSSNS